ncbi:MAG: MBL fold metallo-hydrolase [Actinobacteria bacterium]|nr:MBL fold metallo-hydrolase [Actinomycetota bacterium]
MSSDRLYFRQLLAGRDFAQTDGIARQMVNFSYLIGDRETGECLVVDPAYDVAGLIGAAAADDMRISGALVTHYHADHCGGSMMGFNIEGIEALLNHAQVPIHVQRAEVEWISKVTGVTEPDLVAHGTGDHVMVGEIKVDLIHTPGHTPGSQCFLVHDHLVSGDTLFLEGCGRTDLPGGNAEDLYYSLTQRLAKVPDTAVLFPGHQYSAEPSASMADTRQQNFVFRPNSVEQWMTMFGG